MISDVRGGLQLGVSGRGMFSNFLLISSWSSNQINTKPVSEGIKTNINSYSESTMNMRTREMNPVILDRIEERKVSRLVK